MDAFIELFKAFSFTDVLVVIVLLSLGLKGAAELLKAIRRDLESWYQKKRGVEKKEETLEERVKRLEENDMGQIEKLEQIEDSVQKLTEFLEATVKDRNARLDEITESNKKANIVTIRSILMYLWNKSNDQGYMTPSQFETYAGLSELYKALDGNGLFRHKILPAMDAMKIQNDE